MAEFRGYFYIENLGLTNEQRDELVSALMALGLRNDSIYPNERNHWAIRPDNQAVIFEAVFNSDNLEAEAIKTRLVNLFGVDPETVTYNVIQTDYGPVVTYKYLTENKLRGGVFGGLSATWDESHEAALLFLSDNKDDWQGVELP